MSSIKCCIIFRYLYPKKGRSHDGIYARDRREKAPSRETQKFEVKVRNEVRHLTFAIAHWRKLLLFFAWER